MLCNECRMFRALSVKLELFREMFRALLINKKSSIN